MKEEIEKRRAEAAERKKQKEDEPLKPAFTISPKGSSKVSSGLRRLFMLTSSRVYQYTQIGLRLGNIHL